MIYDDGHDVTWHLAMACACELNEVKGTCLSCLARAEIRRLRAELAAWQGTVRAHEHVGHELRDEIERRRAQVMELLPWAETGAEAQAETTTGDRRQAALDLLDRIEAGNYF